ncbi:LOW QUALITY PROTEIN: SUMO protease [Phytophthora megakarya]|uniref:SUMO protease n=1 Tax=Phytophthora megakarya TaxID=4795 RepID=A0A225WZ92_9STRA|nr:LOW QUALITY PROTEIN: SUMO protease [Phytophthora megakarya]
MIVGKTLDHFKAANMGWEAIQVVMVDKDMNEISVIKHSFPDATVLLCHFHVLKYRRTVIREGNVEFGAERASSLPQKLSKTRSEGRKTFNFRLEKRGELAFEDVGALVAATANKDRSLADLVDLFSAVPVQYQDAELKHPKFRKDKNPIIAASLAFLIPYRLARKISGSFLKMPLPSQSDEDPPYENIAGIGNFTLFQLDSMQKIWTLKQECDKGSSLLTSMKANCSNKVKREDVVARIKRSHPYQAMHPEYKPDLKFYYMYQLGPGQWMKATIFQAFAKILQVETLSTVVSANALYTCLVIYFSRSHWTMIAINSKKKAMLAYDPLCNKDYITLLTKVTDTLMAEAELKGYKIGVVGSPVQKDGSRFGMLLDEKVSSAFEDADLVDIRFRVVRSLLDNEVI